ncbi:MAG: hypothetical protein F4Y60_04690 [Boseongicola sp. SB0664_bin_43]|uniref:Uncharacterized protein n=1 Tax=Boseongicola sp. SB0664_bin_43 TaxID=2604844 RepID=A0A6B0XZY6_9RHOB|nr:hypothetical protein [Boseongicola sp. SB0664_bin_43]
MRNTVLALVSGVLMFGSASSETLYRGSCVSAMVGDMLLENYRDMGRLEYRRLEGLQTSIYEGIHRTGILIGRHVDEAKMVLSASESCNRSHGRDGLVCDLYSVFDGAARSLQVYTDETGIVIKTEIVPL